VVTDQLIYARPAVVSTYDMSQVDQTGRGPPIHRHRLHHSLRPYGV